MGAPVGDTVALGTRVIDPDRNRHSQTGGAGGRHRRSGHGWDGPSADAGPRLRV